MPLSESDTRAKLIDPAIHARQWTEDLIRPGHIPQGSYASQWHLWRSMWLDAEPTEGDVRGGNDGTGKREGADTLGERE